MERTSELRNNQVEIGSPAWFDAIERNFSRDWGRYDEGSISRGLAFYTSYLPCQESALRRQSFIDILSARIRQKGKASILDIGCGVGQALADIKDQFGDSVETWGITASNLASRKTIPKIDQYIVSDVMRTEKIPFGKFDVICAFQSFKYFADPVFVMERSWRWLAQDGYCFIDSLGSEGIDVYWLGLRVPTSGFVELAKSCGYDFSQDQDIEWRQHDISFRKNGSELILPMIRSEIYEDSDLVFKVKYKWMGRVPKNIARDIMDANERVFTANPS